MARNRSRPSPTPAPTLQPVATPCPECGTLLGAAYPNRRTVTTLDAVQRLTGYLRRCANPDRSRYHRPFHPEAESLLALPHQAFGLDALARIGRLCHAEQRRVPEIPPPWTRRGVTISPRSVTHLLDRSDELRAVATADRDRRLALLRQQRRVVLAIDGLRPEVGHEVLGVRRDRLSGEVVLAKSLLSATINDLTGRLTEVQMALPVPIQGAISDGRDTIRKAIAQARPGVPHPPCPFHDPREAARLIDEAERHAKNERKKTVRGVRAIERAVEGAPGEQAEVVRDDGAAVRSARTDDGRPPREASGLKLRGRREPSAASRDRVAGQVGRRPKERTRLRRRFRRGREQTAALWPAVRASDRGVKRVARHLGTKGKRSGKDVRRGLSGLRSKIRPAASESKDPVVAERLRWFGTVSRSDGSGWFPGDESADRPRTNNDWEHRFGSHRDHERRARGRQQASPGVVVPGAVRVVASLATRLRPDEGLRRRTGDVEDGRHRRTDLDKRREGRRKPRRFRRDPASYLSQLEERSLQASLPASFFSAPGGPSPD